MPYIKIDKDNKQIAVYSDFAGLRNGSLQVNTTSPSTYHRLVNGEWVLNTESAKAGERDKKINSKYDKELNNLIWNEVKKNKDHDLDNDDLIEVDKKIK